MRYCIGSTRSKSRAGLEIGRMSISTHLSRIVVMLTLDQDKLAALQRKLQTSNSGSKITYRAADVGNYEAIDAAVAYAVEQFGKIDILINNVRNRVSPC